MIVKCIFDYIYVGERIRVNQDKITKGFHQKNAEKFANFTNCMLAK